MSEEQARKEQQTPAVIAWRVGQLEIALKEFQQENQRGFLSVQESIVKLNETLAQHYMTKAEANSLEKQATLEHNAIKLKIEETRTELDADIISVRTEIKDLKKRNWVQNTLSAIAGALLALATAYIFNDIIR